MTSAKKNAGKAAAKSTTVKADRPAQILDAAEALFAVRGYYGTSVRDIAERARVVPSHVVYAFGSKEKLYAAVFLRRVDELVRAREDRLDEIERAGVVDLEAILRSFVTPLLKRSTSGEPGWKNYAMLISQAHNGRAFYEQGELDAVIDKLDSSGRSLVRTLERAVPGLTKRDALLGFLFFVSAMLNVFAESGRIDRLSKGKIRSSDLEGQCGALIPFCAAGFRGLVKPQTKKSG